MVTTLYQGLGGAQMPRYRDALPQLAGALFLTDGGIETTLIFHEGLELPDFAAFHLLKTPEGEAALHKYFRTYAGIAKRYGTGLILSSRCIYYLNSYFIYSNSPLKYFLLKSR